MPENLQLMVFLDSTKNAVAIKEAYNRNIPTIAIVNASNDMSHVSHLHSDAMRGAGFVSIRGRWKNVVATGYLRS
jgi:hypothetical protein